MTSNQQLREAVEAAATAFEQGRVEEARARAQAVLDAAPGEPNASQILALILMQQGRAKEAVSHLQSARRNAPGHPPLLNLLGVALGLTGDREGARAAFTEAKTAAPEFLDARTNLAQLEIDDQNYGAAAAEFDSILAQQPRHAEALAGRAKAALWLKDVDGAANYAEQAIAAHPGVASAHLTLAEARLRQEQFAEAETIALRVAQGQGVSPLDRANAFGLAADAADRLGAYDEAFARYSQANNLFADTSHQVMAEPPSSFHPETVRRLTAHLEDGDGASPPAVPEGEPLPAFLMGFPRSGTTLLEQILLAHPQMISHGEHAALANACGPLITSDQGLAKLAALSAEEAGEARRRYWQEVGKIGALPGAGQIFLDKMPLNTVFLPVIAKVFPGAKIFFAVRDPRDVVLSCVQQRFVINQAMYQLLSVESAARYYDEVMTLGVKARELYDFALREVRYDDVVADLEAEARNAIAFLGLDWDEGVLAYRERLQERAIATPSVGQVVEPIYTRAIGKWRNYEAHLAPAKGRLSFWAHHWGYTD